MIAMPVAMPRRSGNHFTNVETGSNRVGAGQWSLSWVIAPSLGRQDCGPIALGVEGIEFQVEIVLGGFAGVDGAAEKLSWHVRRHRPASA
jgi:hypothetical protein